MAVFSYKDGPTAKKSLGQNFLQDKNIAKKIVNCVDIGDGDNVIEIGPGPGALTTYIRQFCVNKFILLEKDSFWAAEHAQLEGTHPQALGAYDYGFSPDFLVLEGDALAMEWGKLTFPCRIVSNLPYNIASPLMWDIVSQAPQLLKAVFMVQKEVGLRLVAQPKTKAYGALSVWIQSFCSPKLEFIVPPQVFYPPPKIHSAVVSFLPLEKQLICEKESLARLLHICFQSRRKQMGTIFKKNMIDLGVLHVNRINVQNRPEELTPLQFQELAKSFDFFSAK